jgi:hypothetical protein
MTSASSPDLDEATMLQETCDVPTADDLPGIDGSRKYQRELSSGSVAIQTSLMSEDLEDVDDMSVAPHAHHTYGPAPGDFSTASSSKAATRIIDKESRISSLNSDIETTRNKSHVPGLRDEIVEHEHTNTPTFSDDRQAHEANEGEVDQLQPSNEINSFTFIKDSNGVYRPGTDQRLRNNLLPSVGFLEFANATDFAANVWNTIPVPKFASVLMGLGGAIALLLVPFAIKDGILCWKNSRMLIQERILLLREAEEVVDEEKGKLCVVLRKGLDMRLEVNRKELGTELFDRGIMDMLMGFSALLVGIGTLMAIGGANPRVYHASNLLSGYIGNSPSTFWGLCNSGWCVYVFSRARHHLALGRKTVDSDEVRDLLKRRVRSVQCHSIIMGVSTLVSAAGGMITVTHWYGYLMLIPCILAAIFGNWYFRNKLGYDRRLARIGHTKMSTASLIKEIKWTTSKHASLVDARQSPMFSESFTESKSIAAITELMVRCDLFEDLCERLLSDVAFASMMEEAGSDGSVIISPAEIFAASEQMAPLVIDTAKAVMQERGPRQLRQKQRCLLEMLGASVVEDQRKASHEISEKQEGRNG